MGNRLILVGGSAGSGKTTVAQTLASDLEAGWLQLDTVWIAMKGATRRGSPAYSLLDVDGRMRRGGDSDEELLAAHVGASETVCGVLPEVFAFELETRRVLVADGPGCCHRSWPGWASPTPTCAASSCSTPTSTACRRRPGSSPAAVVLPRSVTCG